MVVNIVVGNNDDGGGVEVDQNFGKLPVLLVRGTISRGGDGNGFVVVLVIAGAAVVVADGIGIDAVGSTIGSSVVF